MINKPDFLPYDEARKIVRSLNIKTQREWYKYVKKEDFPINIPKAPRAVYKEWVGMIDWLGTNKKPFEECREFVQSLNLKTRDEWKEYIKRNNFLIDIPKNPAEYYKDDGWNG